MPRMSDPASMSDPGRADPVQADPVRADPGQGGRFFGNPSLGRGLFLALALIVAGCGLTARSVDVPQAQTLATSDVPVFDRAAIGALVERLRGAKADDIARDFLVAGSDKIAPEPGFRYDGFALRQVKFITQSTDDAGRRRVSALLHFEDPIARKTAAMIDLSYRSTPNGIELTEAAWVPLFAAHPRTALFVVPGDALLADKAEALKDYRSLFRFALLNGIPMRERAAASVSSETKVILVFLLDRAEPGSEFSVRLSDRRGTHDGYAADTRYVHFDDGWAAALVPGRFSLDGTGAFWIKAVYRPGPVTAETAGAGERLVGLYSSAPAPAESSR